MPSKQLHSTQVDLDSNTLPTKGYKMDREESPVMQLETLREPFSSSALSINRTPTNKWTGTWSSMVMVFEMWPLQLRMRELFINLLWRTGLSPYTLLLSPRMNTALSSFHQSGLMAKLPILLFKERIIKDFSSQDSSLITWKKLSTIFWIPLDSKKLTISLVINLINKWSQLSIGTNNVSDSTDSGQ